MLRKTTEFPLNGSTDLNDHRGRYGAELPELENAILATITYRDLFDYPVTFPEIHRYLHGIRCDQGEVRRALQGSEFVNEYLATDGEYFALNDREALFDLRRKREAYAEQLWSKALAHGAVLASLPFVRMVAVTGSLAVNNPGHDADTDFMLVTDAGRVWSVRLMAKVLQLLNGVFASGELCVNHLVSTRALELDNPSLYVAQELTQQLWFGGS